MPQKQQWFQLSLFGTLAECLKTEAKDLGINPALIKYKFSLFSQMRPAPAVCVISLYIYCLQVWDEALSGYYGESCTAHRLS